MNPKTLRIVAAACLVLSMAAVWSFTSFLDAEQTAKSSPLENDARSGSGIVEGYKTWTRVNPVPAVLPSRVARMCFTPTAEQIKREEDNPHNDKFITVYVNDIGRHAMTEMKVSRFPKGSVIVKEKLAAKDSSSPELLTVMIKREAGYNPENGDWEYMGLDGSAKTVQARGKLEKCQACHRTVSHNDYVFREYLPQEVWKKLW
jgi:hypothetical protein